jgi:hypothetical protein
MSRLASIFLVVALVLLPARRVSAQCDCPCLGDPDCDGFFTALDVGQVVDVAFSGQVPETDPLCPLAGREDLNCDCAIDILDVAEIIASALYCDIPPCTQCDPCGSTRTNENAQQDTDPKARRPDAAATGVAQGNSVVVSSLTVGLDSEGVRIPVRLTNEDVLQGLTVPLVIRAIDPRAFIDKLAVTYEDRLAASNLDIEATNLYFTADGTCKGPCYAGGSTGGFATIDTTGAGPQAISASPVGLLCVRQALVGDLAPGTDTTGSIVLTVDVNSSVDGGEFEIDTTCTAPNNHLLFVGSIPTDLPILPAFTRGVIRTVACWCPNQQDYDGDTFITAVDLAAMIDILFGGAPDIQDPVCVTTRSDMDCDGFSTPLDLGAMIDYLFAYLPGPCAPCDVLP